MNGKVLLAVFKRNFVSYFASPTGYAFITVFVWLCVFAAFWPNDFFNNNLASLEQLNKYFPFIMLVFIPAITMSVWADERRQGTDELLLTIPASDLDIVLGKYLAAVAIYTVALVFSLVCSYAVLSILGSPDFGLFLATYAGYWLVGLAMLAIGMAASFLTGNLTVAFILGALFNVPLVLAVWADSILSRDAGLLVKQWSIGEQFRDFGRGIVTLSGVVYFGMLVAAMLYISMVLIARRHWVRDKDWYLQAGHYTVRAACLAVAAIGLSVLLHYHDLRLDATSERLSSLSGKTRELLGELNPSRPVQIEAFISPAAPESYVQARLNLVSVLQELAARGGGNVQLRINNTELFSEEAVRAEKRFGIAPRKVRLQTRGQFSEDQVFLGVAFTCGLQKVVLPFIDRGVPIEYELVRSLAAVTQQKRKRVGVLRTDAPVLGGFEGSMGFSEEWPIVKELKKAYEMVPVDATQPIKEKYDVLLAVQPSSLGPEQMNNFVAALRSGQPTAVFEDPSPVFFGGVPGTLTPRRPPSGMNPMMMMGQPGVQKGDINQLWRLLGVHFSGMSGQGGPRIGEMEFGRERDIETVYQDYNPFPRFPYPGELVFVDTSVAKDAFDEQNPVSSKLQHVLFPFPGYITPLHASSLQYETLVRTGDKTGTVKADELFERSPFGGRGLNENRRKNPTKTRYAMAVYIHGRIPASQPMADEGAPKIAFEAAGGPAASGPPQKAEPGSINVILVSDIDWLSPDFFHLREMGDPEEGGTRYDFDNVTFVLNVLDYLAGDNSFIEIRKRRPVHRTLTAIDKATDAARKQAADATDQLFKKATQAIDEEKENLTKQLKEVDKELQAKGLSSLDIDQEKDRVRLTGERRIEAETDRLKRERDQDIYRIRTNLEMAIRGVQDRYKFWAVVLPPIPPLIVGTLVFVVRRAQEREGVSRKRLR